MKNKVSFAILKYIPNLQRDERINLGVVLHQPGKELIDMTIVTNWKRVKHFDDEADIKFLKSYINDFKQEIMPNLLNNKKVRLNDIGFLDDATEHFVNKFVFEIQKSETSLDFKAYFNHLIKTYLYYDLDKKNRPTEKETKKFIEEQLSSFNVNYEKIGTKNAIKERYGNNINVDYKIKNVYYKLISLNESNYVQYVTALKMWIANTMILAKEKKKIVLIIDQDLSNDKIDNYKKMLKEMANVIGTSEFLEKFKK